MLTKVQEATETVVERERVFDIAPIRPRGGRGSRGGGGGGGGPNGGGGGPNGGGGGGNDRDSGRDWSPDKFRLGVYVGIVSILTMFAALGLAYAMRMSTPGAGARSGFELPHLLWLSTVLIVSSSFTFLAAKYQLRRGQASAYWGWLAATLLLGLCFILSQVLAWRQLVAQQFFFATNPQSTFFYVLTALHALHLAGGVVALGLLLLHARRPAAYLAEGPKTAAYTDAVGLYWHFMDLLWLGILALLIFES